MVQPEAAETAQKHFSKNIAEIREKKKLKIRKKIMPLNQYR